MDKPQRTRSRAAFTLIELMIVIAIIGLLAALYLPVASRAKQRARQTECLSNLKQIGIGFRLFANDHNGLYPMRERVRNGGSYEYVSTPETWRHFITISNTLTTPKLLHCPSDRERSEADSWTNFNNLNLSYFVGLDAIPDYHTHLLAGDRNIAQGSQVILMSTNSTAMWTREIHDKQGNILFADGRAERLNNKQLTKALLQHSMSHP